MTTADVEAPAVETLVAVAGTSTTNRVKNLTFQGLTFANPPLFKFLLLGEYALDFGVHRVVGISASPQDFLAQFRVDPTELYLIARAKTRQRRSAKRVNPPEAAFRL